MIKEYEYYGFKIEIYQHPIYHDYEYVIKSADGNVVRSSSHPFEEYEEVLRSAEIKVHEL